MLEIQFGEASHPGKVHPNNEDAVGSYVPTSRSEIRSHGYFFALADGVGSSDYGEVAAATAIAVVMRDFAQAKEGVMLSSLLPYLMQQANSAIYHRMLSPRYMDKKLATTLLLCALRYDQAEDGPLRQRLERKHAFVRNLQFGFRDSRFGKRGRRDARRTAKGSGGSADSG